MTVTSSNAYPEIALDELPRYSDWPARLMTPSAVNLKTEPEVWREFDREKWGELLKHAKESPEFDLNAAERLEIDPETIIPAFDSGKLLLAPYKYVLARHLELYADVLGSYAGSASALVEFGAGFGSKLLRLSDTPPFDRLPLFAAELTNNGRALIELLAQRAGKQVAVGACDFREGTMSSFGIPVDSIIFTSFAAHYVPLLSSKFVELFSGLMPKVIVHFEPCLEHLDEKSLHQLMCRHYILRNDYNRNIASLLKSEERNGRIRIFSIQKNVMGGNPLLPLSVIAWTPTP